MVNPGTERPLFKESNRHSIHSNPQRQTEIPFQNSQNTKPQVDWGLSSRVNVPTELRVRESSLGCLCFYERVTGVILPCVLGDLSLVSVLPSCPPLLTKQREQESVVCSAREDQEEVGDQEVGRIIV